MCLHREKERKTEKGNFIIEMSSNFFKIKASNYDDDMERNDNNVSYLSIIVDNIDK